MQRRALTQAFAAVWITFVGLSVHASPEWELMATIQDYRDGTSGVRARNPEMNIQVSQVPDARDESVLVVDYPASTGDPAGRDVWCDTIDKDWTIGDAILFNVKPSEPVRISVSFLGKNKVAYTSWADLKGGEWQAVRIQLNEIQPNPYFQPPGVDKNSRMDVSEVAGIGFAPQSPGSGQLMMGRFMIVK